MVSAWVGGFGPGLLTTFLAALGAAYFWVPPLRSLWIIDPGEWLGLVVFMVVGTVISGLNEAWRRGTVALADSEQRLAVTLASIGDAVLTTDENGDILTMNEVAEATHRLAVGGGDRQAGRRRVGARARQLGICCLKPSSGCLSRMDTSRASMHRRSS